jgi:acyl-CoA thioester hydrolase
VGRAHTHEIRVRYAECDAQGRVFNAHYFTYFDVAITELFRAAIGSYGAMVESGVDVVVAEASARYLGAAAFDDLVEVEIRVEELGTTSMVTALRVRRGPAVLVVGRLVHVFVSTDTMAKTPIPDAIRAALA